MQSDVHTGALLRSLSGLAGVRRILELGTGLGLSASWIVEGMSSESTLDSVENDAALTDFSASIFRSDPRVRITTEDGADFIARAEPASYDLVFADTWPGKYSLLEETLALVKPGGIYLIDDMLPQPNWPEGHAEKAKALLEKLESRADLQICKLACSTGLVLCVKLQR